MLKNRSYILIIACSVFLVIGLYFVLVSNTKESATPAIKAVPLDASLIVESRDLESLLSIFSEDNQLWTELTNIPLMEQYNKSFVLIKSILSNNKDILTLLDEKTFIASAHLKGNNTLDFLFLISMANSVDMQVAQDYIRQALSETAQIVQKNYNDVYIYDVKFSEEHKDWNFSYSFTNGIFLVSFSSILLEEAIRQLDTETSLLSLPDFVKVSSTAGQNVDANIYLSYRNFSRQILDYLAESHKDISFSLANFGSWSEADIKMRDNALILNGFTCTEPNQNNYLNIFLNQPSMSIDIERVLPRNTSNFIVFGIEDLNKFKTNYKRYLELSGGIHKYKHHINKIKKTYHIDIEEIFYSLIKDEIALVYTEITSPQIDDKSFVIFKTQDKHEADQKLLNMLKQYALSQNVDFNAFINPFTISEESYFIYQMPIINIPQKLFGDLFASTKPSFYTFIDEYLIFGSSIPELKQYIRDVVMQKTLGKSAKYKEFTNLFTSNSNIYFYSSISRSPILYTLFLNNELRQSFDEHFNTFKNFEAIGVQFTSGKEMIYSNLCINYNPNANYIPSTKWECPIEANVNIKPQFFTNHYTFNDEIFIQDLNNKIYLISPNGKILWSRQLEGKIMGDIHKIDFYKNNKWQIMINTKHNLHLIDRNGNDAAGYPIRLPSPATNGISVFDYNDTKNYRIFFAAENRRIYLFDKHGKPIKGWKFGTTDSHVYSEVQFVRSKRKDYIVFSDETKTYILNRRGKIRVKLETNFAKSMNNKFIFEDQTPNSSPRLVTTSPSGEICFLYLSGKVRKMSIKEYSHTHYFDYEDLNGDGQNDFIFADNTSIEVYDKNKKLLFSQQLNGDIKYPPAVYTFSANEKKLGYIDTTNGEIYLINGDGTIYKGFPKSGNSMFSIGILKRNAKKFNLIVGSSKNSVYNYEIQ